MAYDQLGRKTSYTYDARGAKLTEQYPDHTGGTSPGNLGYGIVTFVYDNAGRVLRKQDQQGDTVTFNYDLAGRMSSRDFRLRVNSPSGTIAESDVFTYDRAGRMLTAYAGRFGNTVTQVYDSVGRKASEALLIAAQTYTVGINYNARGELIKYTYPDGSIVDRTYHATGNLHQVKLAGTTLDTRTYDAGGRMATSTYQNGATQNDEVSPLAPVLRGEGKGVRGRCMAYTWDANKNKLSEVLTGVNATVNGYGFNAVDTTYDFEDRLTQWKRANGAQNQSWSLTAVGDWQSQTVNGTATSRTHGPTHELTAIGASSLSYDAKGNLTQDTSRSPTQNYVWDYDNKMRSADIDGNGSADVSFEYDALGRRVARTQGADAVVYFQVDQQTICDYPRGGAAASPTYRYYWGSYIDELIARKATGTGGEVLFAHRNQQYSIYAYSNSSGAVVERIAYTAYGQPTFMNAAGTVQSTSPNSIRYSYTGREWDASLQLHHFRARWMGPVMGRFLGRDPIGYDGSKWMQYELNDGNSLRHIDPLGLKCEEVEDAVWDIPADPSKCAWLLYYMGTWSNLLQLIGYDKILLDHYINGGGSPLQLPMDAFDFDGSDRESLLDDTIHLFNLTHRLNLKSIPCGQRKFMGSISNGPISYVSELTPMIAGYRLQIDLEVNGSRSCQHCGDFCALHLSARFRANDITAFRRTKVFGAGMFCVADRLVLACGIGQPFNISGMSLHNKSIKVPCESKEVPKAKLFSDPYLPGNNVH